MVLNGSVVRVPLESYRVPGIQLGLFRARISLWIQVSHKHFKERTFTVDSASALTTLAVADAHDLGLPISQKTIRVNVESATGVVTQIRHPGRLRGRVPGLDGWDFDWPCHFVEHSGPPPKAVIGLAGVLDDLRITFDGEYSQDAPYIWLILERRRQ